MKTSSVRHALPVPLLVGLLGGLVITLFWLWLTAAASASPHKPHAVPVAVIGPAPAVGQLAAGLATGNAFRVVTAPTEATAIDLVQHRHADAIVNFDTEQIQTVQAASMLTALALPQTLHSRQATRHFSVNEIKPSASGDPTGLGLMFISLACVLGGLPSGVALALLSKKRRPASLPEATGRIALIVAFSGIMALFIALVADGVLGYGGKDMLVVWAWGTMLCVATMGAAAASIAAIGAPGILMAALPILFFGVASAPEPSSWNWQANIFRTLGPYDPFGATTNGIINGVFFAPATQTKNLLVLAVWMAVPVLVLGLLGLRTQPTRRIPVVRSGDVRELEEVGTLGNRALTSRG